MGEACAKTGWRIHAYVLMGNHYHLLVETPEGNLVAGMKWLQGAYTQRPTMGGTSDSGIYSRAATRRWSSTAALRPASRWWGPTSI
jgi:REP element-mobilizing transposase RayT